MTRTPLSNPEAHGAADRSSFNAPMNGDSVSR